MKRYRRVLHWFRRDLRSTDNAALAAAREAGVAVYCAFVFDTEILERLPRRADRRVEFIHASVAELKAALESLGGTLIVLHGPARDELPRLAHRLGVDAVYANHDYEPLAVARDRAVREALAASAIAFHTRKDHVIFEKDELLSGAGAPYSVYTPYRNAWLRRYRPEDAAERAVAAPAGGWAAPAALPAALPRELPALAELGFESTGLRATGIEPGMSGARRALEDFVGRMPRYAEARDYPALKGPSYLSVHLRFGTLGVREAVRAAQAGASPGARLWLSELIWRDFYFMILHHHPHVVAGAFKPRFDRLAFDNDPALYAAWCEARTGYPIVDAAMRQINRTGYMHNRLRMIAASFLVKDLLVDWRMGERYFADRLNDFDLAANNGGWQWAASTGCDAQPWFRIFNPVSQSQRFDPQGRFIRRYLPELAKVPDRWIHAPWTMSAADQQAAGCVIGRDYPAPVVDHAERRAHALAMFQAARAAD
jgi:deoxyribodipyrimidine photo-lyase